jgi:NADPH:quinone reductase-like Zn-dependent oxidoreductase
MAGIVTPRRKVLGVEFSGRVESVGRSVTRFKAGDEVFGSTGLSFGAHAEYLCIPEHGSVDLKPANTSHEEAAAVMFGGISALHFIRKAQITRGQKVLVYGASGSVGVAAVQLARQLGAAVTGVCSGANLDLIRSLGASTAIDYAREDFSAAGPVYDVIIDAVGKSGFVRPARALKPGGMFVQIGLPDLASMLRWAIAAASGKAKVIGGMARAEPADQQFLKELIEADEYRTVIDRSYALEEISEAHRHAQGGHKRGNVVVIVTPSSSRVSAHPRLTA